MSNDPPKDGDKAIKRVYYFRTEELDKVIQELEVLKTKLSQEHQDELDNSLVVLEEQGQIEIEMEYEWYFRRWFPLRNLYR